MLQTSQWAFGKAVKLYFLGLKVRYWLGTPDHYISVDSPLCPLLKLLLVSRLEISFAFQIQLLLCDLTGQMKTKYNSKLSKLYFNRVQIKKRPFKKTDSKYIKSESQHLQQVYLIHGSHYCEFMHILILLECSKLRLKKHLCLMLS